MRLSELVTGFRISPPDADPDITGITEDSRKVKPGMLFVAVPGTLLDGHAYIADALTRGAAGVVAERTGAIPSHVPHVRVPSSRTALAMVAARYFGTSGLGLSLIGFTGTFGKTSTSEILRALLDAAGSRTGVLGSLGARFRGFIDPGEGLTTPAPVELHRALRGLASAGASTVILEVTSHALKLGRVDGLRFAGGLLAAIMPGEHTDFHRSYEDYVEAKRLFLTYLEPSAPLAYDADNRAARQVISGRLERGPSMGFSLEGREADVRFYDVSLSGDGASFTVGGRLLGARTGIKLRSPLLGSAHLRNTALALTYALGVGLPVSAAEAVISNLVPLRRRMERYEAGGRMVLDDTAAHSNSFRATLEVASLIPHNHLVVVYALRGRRGTEINRQNAAALADLAFLHGADSLIVTSAADQTGAADEALPIEIDATRQALVARGRKFVWHDYLDEALRDALQRTRAGDLIVLVGAQGMNEGKRVLGELARMKPEPRTPN
jgi:UDP-N-acetylmuramoyl-L-alanyl-D-glutamate--2,6-diaminopimelate ligase